MKMEQMAHNETTPTERNRSYKKKYKVILVAPEYIVYEKDGNAKCQYGKFDVKVGDSIEI